MVGYISRNLEKYLNADYVNIFKQTINESNIDTVISNINHDYKHIIIDINCINDKITLYKLLTKIRQQFKVQIIIIYYQYINYEELYSLGVYDFISVQNIDKIQLEIDNIIATPNTISHLALAQVIKKKVNNIVGFVNIEHNSFTTTFIEKLLANDKNSFLLETNNCNNFLSFESKQAANFLDTHESIMDMINKLPNNISTLYIDFGKLKTLNKKLFLELYNQMDCIYMVDTKNRFTRNTTYYQKALKIQNSDQRFKSITIPNNKNKFAYAKQIMRVKKIK